MDGNFTHKDIVRIRLIFIFIIILSNAVTYTLVQPSDLSVVANKSIFARLDYVYFKAEVILKTPFVPGAAFTLSSLNEKIIIKNVFMEQMKVITNPIEQVDQASVELVMNIHKDDFLKVRRLSKLIAYPNDANLTPSTKKGTSYEVSY